MKGVGFLVQFDKILLRTDQSAEATPSICYLAGTFRDGCISTQWQIKIKQKSRQYLLNKIIPILNQESNLHLTERAVYLQADANRRFYVAFKRKKAWGQLRKTFSIPPDSVS
ncbi:MAG: hypothetical protein WED04_02330 [Promethearchaeati archaeon SRVP18_Atabeyarchaeia-1]